MSRFYLTKSRDAWIELSHLPNRLKKLAQDNYTDIFKLHPTVKSAVRVYDKETDSHKDRQIFRYYKSYLQTPRFDSMVKKSYMFSDEAGSNIVNEFPEVLEPFLKHVKELDKNYNQSVVNWYEDGEDYIDMHSDCTAKMIDDASVLIINLNEGPNEDSRKLLITLKEDFRRDLTEQGHRIVKQGIKLEHGLVIIMGGRMQELFRHGIARDADIKTGRVSLTFRQMREN